jgi:hypothetical protein
MTVDAIWSRIHAIRRQIVQSAMAQGILPAEAPARFPELYQTHSDLVHATWALTLDPNAATHNARFCTWKETP